MKKLVMMALVLGMGIAANAAATQWTAGAMYVPTIDAGGNVALTTTAMTWSGGNYALYIVNQAAGHEGELIKVDVGTPTISSDGKIAAADLWDGNTSATKRDTYGKDGYLYLQLIGSYNDGSYDYAYDSGVLSKNLTQITGSTGQKYQFSGAKSKWTATAVPEPTSGLLLLLGVAGMALRRRRA